MTIFSKTEQAFWELLQSGIHGTVPRIAFFENLTGEDWAEIYVMAKRQTVCGVCYHAFCRLPDTLLPAGELLLRWVARVAAIESANVTMRKAVVELVALLRKSGLHPVVQKGLSVARFYEHPDSRECGDIDLWVPSEEMWKAISAIKPITDNLAVHSDGSFSSLFGGFVVELHRSLINISNPRARRKLDSYIRKYVQTEMFDTAAIPYPPAILELLLVNIHIMRHAMGTGIGLRHICDYVLASKALMSQIDSNEYAELCQSLGISGWTSILNEFSVRYLKALPSELPESGWHGKKRLPVEKLLEIIREGGNFGRHSGRGGLLSRVHGTGKLHTLLMFVRRSRFAAMTAPVEAMWNIIRLTLGQIHI